MRGLVEGELRPGHQGKRETKSQNLHEGKRGFWGGNPEKRAPWLFKIFIRQTKTDLGKTNIKGKKSTGGGGASD